MERWVSAGGLPHAAQLDAAVARDEVRAATVAGVQDAVLVEIVAGVLDGIVAGVRV